MTEHERIAALARILGGGGAQDPALRVEVGIGDDAAVLACSEGGRLVVTVDEQVEDTHFRRSWLSLEDVGYRATMAAASDVAAMGGRPRAIFASLTLPRALSDEELFAIAKGQADAAAALGARVAGGNLARGPALSIGTTVLGVADGAGLQRSGARPGDDLLLAGPVGRAGAGLAALVTERLALADEGGAVGAAARVCLDAFRRPLARVEAGLAAVRGGARALIDVSDGLGADAGHLARSSGVRVVLEERTLTTDASLATLAARLSRSALDLALGGGEDYALLAAVPAGVQLPGFVRVGSCEAGPGEVVVALAGGARVPAPKGWDHFR